MIIGYNEYKIEMMLESLILESNLELSNGLKDILSIMSYTNKIANKILIISNRKMDYSIVQNFIDVSDNKEEVTFIADKKAQQLSASSERYWQIIGDAGSKYLTYNKKPDGTFKNSYLFNRLGFDPYVDGGYIDGSESNKDLNTPHTGKKGKVLSETTSQYSHKTFVVFEYEDNGEIYKICLNKDVVILKDDSVMKSWTTNRNKIRVGRLLKSILKSTEIEATEKEIEEFVNLYKSSYDVVNDALSKFSLVKGDDIAEWYKSEHYESFESTLGNSCMMEKDSDFFEIYTYNTDVCSLLILFSDNGKIINGKYEASTIKGRALVWKASNGDTIMDRIYTNNDSDINLFKQYAIRNNWWYKAAQNSASDFTPQRGGEYKSMENGEFTIDIKYCDFGYYPYVDTFKYLDVDNSTLSNWEGSASRRLTCTDGTYDWT